MGWAFGGGGWVAGAPRDQPFARREARGRRRYRAAREGISVIASRAGFGSIPLRCGFWWAPRDQPCARREQQGSVPHIYTKRSLHTGGVGVWGRGLGRRGSAGPTLRPQGSSGKGTLSRCARGDGVIASRAGSGSIPLRCESVGSQKGSKWGRSHIFTQKGHSIRVGWVLGGWVPGQGLRGTSPAPAGKLGEGEAIALRAGE